jgi:hypothetical protein
MALRITGATTAINIAQSNISNFSLGFWFRRPTTTITEAVSIAVGLGRGLYESTTTLYVNGKPPPSPAVQPATGEWRYLTITKNGGSGAAYAFLDQEAQSASAIWDDYGPVSSADIKFGDSGPYATPLLNMEIAYARAWSSVLTLTQLNTEKNSTTPVITSGLITDLPFIDSLTATSGTSATNSGSGYDFTANLPLVLGGGGASPVDPGVILPPPPAAFGPDRGFGFGY